MCCVFDMCIVFSAKCVVFPICVLCFRRVCCVFGVCIMFSASVLCFRCVYCVFDMCIVFSAKCVVFSICVLCFRCVLCFQLVCYVLIIFSLNFIIRLIFNHLTFVEIAEYRLIICCLDNEVD